MRRYMLVLAALCAGIAVSAADSVEWRSDRKTAEKQEYHIINNVETKETTTTTGVIPRSNIGSMDACAAVGSDCLACSRIVGCAFCGDADASHVGGWIFKQKGLFSAVSTDTVRQSSTLASDTQTLEAHRRRVLDAEAQLLHDQSGRLKSASRTAPSTVGDLSSVHLQAFLETQSASTVSSSLVRHCFNVTESLHRVQTCEDLRLSPCDCDGTGSEALPECKSIVAEVRTPLVVIGAAMFAAMSIVGGAVMFQLTYCRCGKRF